MSFTANLSSILPLETNSKEVYSAVLKCALLSENLEIQTTELNKLSHKVPPHASKGCTPKYIEKLLGVLIKSLKKQLKDPHKYPFMFNFRRSDQEFWDVLMRFSAYLGSIPNDMVSQRVGNVEALVMIFSKYASPTHPVPNNHTSILLKGTVTAENLDKFCEILRRILHDEFRAHPAYTVTLHRLNHCVESSQDDGTPVASYAQSIVLHLQKLFSCSDNDHLKLVAGYKPICNSHSSFQDLKKCLTHLEKSSAPYFPPEEYLTTNHFTSYKMQERAELSQLIEAMSLRDPGLVSCFVESNAFSPHDYREKPFVLIPKDPRSIYRALVIVITQKELVEVSGAEALSDTSLALLNECALRWRLVPTFKLIANLEATAYFFGNGNLEFDALAASFVQVQRFIEMSPCEHWVTSDRQYLASVFACLVPIFLDTFCANLEDMAHFPISLGHLLLDAVDYMLQSFVSKEKGIDPVTYTDDLSEKIQGIFIHRYELLNKMAVHVPGASEALNLHLMARLIMKDITHSAQLFKTPLLGSIDATAILVEFELKHFTLQAEKMLNGRESELIPVEDALNFYNALVQLYDISKKYVPDLEVGINLVNWFNRQFIRWLAALDDKSLGWVELAIHYDNFEPVSDSWLHSSSVDDLIRCFREQLDFLDKLSWPNDLLESRSMARVAKVIYESIELYADRLVELFQKSNKLPASGSPKTKWEPKWDILKTKPKKEQIEDITKEQCIFINNIFYLRKRTQELFQNFDYQRYSKVLAGYIKEKQDTTPQARMFYIKIISAESLKECDSGKDNDAYAVLSLGGKHLLTTSIQWDNSQPKWNETCGVALDSAQDISIRIFDKDLFSDDLCGEGALYLDPQEDWSSEDADIWLELEPQGRVLFSISTANEKDDPHYYISKAIRILEMHEIDLLQSFKSRFTSAIKSNLSRKNVLHTLSKRRDSGFFKFLGNSSMPIVLQFSDDDCDLALVSLADLIDSHLNLPFSFLYEPCGFRLVISIWRECLLAIESAMVPFFSKKRSTPKPLTKLELDFLLRIVELLKVFFHGGEDGDGLPTQVLEIPSYRLLHTIQGLYFNPTDNLICEYMMVYKTSDASHLNGHSPTIYKADVILRLIQMRGEEHGLRFVESQQAMRSKALAWNHSKKKSPKPKSVSPAQRVSVHLKPWPK